MREPANERGEIVRDVRCPACAAELVGRRATEDCPGCGGRIAELLARQMGRLDERGFLTGATSCARCAYDLRTMALAAACPECGTAVAESALRMRLCEAPLWWLLTVRWGIDVVLLAAMAGLAFPLLFMILWLFFRSSAVPGILGGLGEGFFRFYYFMVSVAIAAGVMMITAHDPSLFQQRRSRRLTRFFAGAAVVVAVGGIVGDVSIERSFQAALIFGASILAIESFSRVWDREGRWPDLLTFVLAGMVSLVVGALAYGLLPHRVVSEIIKYLLRQVVGNRGSLEFEPLLLIGVFGPMIFFGTRYLASIVARIPSKRLAWWIRWHGGISAAFLTAIVLALTLLYFWSSLFWNSVWASNATSSSPVTPPPLLTLLQRLAEFVATIGLWTLGLMTLGIEPWSRFAVDRAIREARESSASGNCSDVQIHRL